MGVKLKPLADQVVVITGASSGIGLVTARLAAKRGARVVLVSRSKPDLTRAVARIQKAGGEAIYVVADVAHPDEVEAIAEEATRAFGGIDSWVNNAGISIYGTLEEVSLADARRLFDTNYWGVVHGSLVAAAHLRESGGAVINVGSIVSDVSVPLQGHYAASKHAVKGFTDTLRMELESSGAPISVSLVKPAAIATPFARHARSYMEREPNLPPPVYDPGVVARTVLRCAQKPVREITVGGGGRMMTAMGKVAPRLTDRYMEAAMYRQQETDRPSPEQRRDSLDRPMKGDGAERMEYPRHVMRSSVYTAATLHPLRTAVACALIGTAAVLALRRGSE
ncbi:MAG: SDR family oxidoreductase [Gemmatimonadetes bacterium]|nr:SDR family oxidoreductase [Gemmatimonadota bacterium]